MWGSVWGRQGRVGRADPYPCSAAACRSRRGKQRSLSPAPRRPAGRCGAEPWGSAVGQSRGAEPWGRRPRPLLPSPPSSPLISSLCSSPGAGPRPLLP